MAQTSQPWDGTVTGDASVAPYSSQEWSDMYKYLFMSSKSDQGPFIGSGTSPDVGLTVQVTNPVSASVEVTAGAATVDGTFYLNTSTVALSIGANASGNPRIDTIILRKDVAAQTVRLAVLVGTPAATPVAASLTQTPGVMWEIPLADVAVANGFSTIVAANIQPRMHFTGMPDGVYLQDVLNNSGALLQTGDVVKWDISADRAVTTSVIAGDPLVAGVWVGRTAAGGYGRVLTEGVGWIRTTGAIAARGTKLVQSTTARQAVGSASGTAVAMSLQTTSATGLCLALVKVGYVPATLATPVCNLWVNLGVVTTTNNTFVDIDATNMKVGITPNGTRVKVTFIVSATSIPAYNANGVLLFDIYSVGLAARAGHTTWGLAMWPNTSGQATQSSVTVSWIFTGLTAGVLQEFKLQWKSSGSDSFALGTPHVLMAEEV